MQKDVWDAPQAEIDGASPARPAPSNRGLIATDVPMEVFEDLKANLAGYASMGITYFAVVTALIMFAMTVLAVGIAPGAILEDEIVMLVGGILGFLAYTAIIVGFTLVGYPLVGASSLRAMQTQMDGGDTIGAGSLFNTMRVDAGRIVGFYLVSQLLILCGMFLLYIPGLVAAMVTTLAMSIHIFEPEVSLSEALTRAFDHFKENPGYHVQAWLLMIPVFLVLELTIVGLVVIYPVLVAWQLVIYRHAFPNGSGAVT